jgi:hypothetical protein
MSLPTVERVAAPKREPKLYGSQQPARLLLPPETERWRTSGPEVIELAQSADLWLDPWQEFTLDAALWELPSPDADPGDDVWEWSAFEVGLLVPRQNGKGAILEARELAGLYLFEEDLILHSAHEFKTSGEAYRRIKGRIENTGWMLRRVASNGFQSAHGNEGIELKPTRVIISGSSGRFISGGRVCRLRFVARTSGSGRGFTADLVIWDEAFNLPEVVVGAQLPTLSAVPNPQLWYTSSAVDREVHQYGVTLARVRARALAEIKGEQAPPGAEVDDDRGGLCWLEWQADEDQFVAAEKAGVGAVKNLARLRPQWAASNPGVGFRLKERRIAREFRAMGLKTFLVERLNIGDWPELDEDAARIDRERWAAIGDPGSRPGEVIALGFEVSLDGRTAAIASAGKRDDGRFHIKVIDHRPGGGTAWLVDRIIDIVTRYRVCVVLYNPAGQADAYATDLENAGLPKWQSSRPGKGGLRPLSAREYAASCGELVADTTVEADRLRHCAQQPLDDAVKEAGTRPLADKWAWDQQKSTADITPLIGVTCALHGFRVHGAEEGVVPWAEYV